MRILLLSRYPNPSNRYKHLISRIREAFSDVIVVSKKDDALNEFHTQQSCFSKAYLPLNRTIKSIKKRHKKYKAEKRYPPLLFPLFLPSKIIPGYFIYKKWKQILGAQNQHFAYDRDLDSKEDWHIFRNNSPWELEDELKHLAPDIMVLAGWEGIIKEPFLCIPKFGILGWHHGLLPSIRGMYSPFYAAAYKRKDWLGITIQKINEGIDTGEIIDQYTLNPKRAKHLIDAHLKLDEKGIEMILKRLRTLSLTNKLECQIPGFQGINAKSSVYFGTPSLMEVLRFLINQNAFFGHE